MESDKEKIDYYQKQLSSQVIEERVTELGEKLSRDFKDKKLAVIGVLNGAFIFMADLVRRITVPVELDFVRVSSYGNQSFSRGQVSFRKGVELSLENKHIILVEDIVDTGRTLCCLKNYFQKMPVVSVKTCVLIDQKERREVPLDVDYAGFRLEKGFLVGYGLDLAEKYRNYPDIYNLDKPV
ncbi:MAG: hypoxanthine phosphoribosyltransferase [Thermodesulfobacteriota bacterium]